jgi:hypothetical protein
VPWQLAALMLLMASAEPGSGGTNASGFFLTKPLDEHLLANLEQEFSLGKGDESTVLTNVPCAKPAADGADKRSLCTGADRMRGGGRKAGGHKYGGCYATVLNAMRNVWARSGSPARIMEVGILSGTGLGVWDSIFAPTGRVSLPGTWYRRRRNPAAYTTVYRAARSDASSNLANQVYGLDGYLNNTRDALPGMRRRGGFRNHDPVLAQIDQLGRPDDLRETARVALGGSKPHLIIDDGMHSKEAIANTFIALMGLLREDGLYIIEGTVLLKDAPTLKFDT